MAIKKDIELKITHTLDNKALLPTLTEKGLSDFKNENIILNDAYIIVESIQGNKEKVFYKLATYTDSTKTTRVKIEDFNFTPDLSTDNTANHYVQAYNHAKTLSQYSDAIDC